MQRLLTESNIHLPSKVELFQFYSRDLYIKRDDLIHPDLSGNKFRKLHFLLSTPSYRYKRIISYGGNQSNAMASIAALCQAKGWKFLYITKTCSTVLKQSVNGNLALALQHGMELLEVSHEDYRACITSLHSSLPTHGMTYEEGDLLLAQGGADLGAEEGIVSLAEEITVWQKEKEIEYLHVITPSGTGTTAYFLAKSLKDVTVLTTPLIGHKSYLLEQIGFLGDLPPNLRILETEKKYHFAKLYSENMKIYQSFLEQNIEMDLLYAPKMFQALSEVLHELEGTLLYVHSGGVQGNVSMLERYQRKNFS